MGIELGSSLEEQQCLQPNSKHYQPLSHLSNHRINVIKETEEKQKRQEHILIRFKEDKIHLKNEFTVAMEPT